MFSKKLLIYFSRTHLFIYHKDLALPLRIEFQEDTIQDLERINKEWVKEKLSQTLNKTNLKNSKAIVILSKDIVFDKLINSDSIEEKEKEIKEFLSEIPLENSLISYKEFIKDSNTLIAAVNKTLYQTLSALLLEQGIYVRCVIPEIVFNRIDFTKTFLSDLLKQKELLTYGNFSEDTDIKKPLNWKFVGIVMGSILVVGTILGIITYTINNKTPKDIQSTENEPTTETSVVEVEKETEEKTHSIDKNLIAITIYNGTGTPGFAGQIEKTISSAGFTNTETANASSFNYTNTIIETSSDISDETISEIREVLKSYLKSFEIRKSLEGTNILHITTGEVLTVE